MSEIDWSRAKKGVLSLEALPRGPSESTLLASPSRASSKKGIILSVEALLAALLLFGAFLVAAGLSASASDVKSALPLLRWYALDSARTGAQQGAWTQMFIGTLPNDSLASGLLDALPPGACVQEELYLNDTTPDLLQYSYVRPSCRRGVDTPSAQWLQSQVLRPNSSSMQFYWVRLAAYPNGE